jgi:sugar phosphate isomerase/epimerase
MNSNNRREFLKSLGLITAGYGLAGSLIQSNSIPSEFSEKSGPEDKKEMFFKISLAEWSFNKSLKAGKMSNLDFPQKAKKDFGLTGVEYVNQFFMDKAKDSAYLAELKKRCDDNGVTSVLIMCDREGNLADADSKKRQLAVENHYKWAEAAKFLGCHSIRVNCAGEGTREEVAKAGKDGLSKLSEFAKGVGINVIVENHGGNSSDGKWLSGVISSVGLPNCGTLPDFGNFCIQNKDGKCAEEYDRYKGVTELMPFAKGVSAKTHDFDEKGNCIETDYTRMLTIVKQAGYKGFVGIEYEGNILSEDDGVRATIKLLEKVGGALS